MAVHMDVTTAMEQQMAPLYSRVVAPYLDQATRSLAGTRFELLLSPSCQKAQLMRLSDTLCAYARDVLAHLVATQLSQENPLWSIDVTLAPVAEFARAAEKVAEDLRDSDAAVLDDVAPLLRSKLARQTRRFVSVSLESCERIWRDRNVLSTELLGKSFGLVTDLATEQSDCHNGGRHTTVVTCEGGRFVYKPRDCRIDVWFKQICHKYLPGVLLQPKTILREDDTGSWAYQEFMTRDPVDDEGGVALYWRNMGRAFAIFHMLGSEDLHAENFVAVGEQPSLIDCETVITGEPAMRGDPLVSPNMSHVSKGFGRDLAATLVMSGLLPSPKWPQAFGGTQRLAPSGDTSPLLAHGKSCLPMLAGSEYDVLGYEDELFGGFEESLAALSSVSDALCDDLQSASGIPVRRLMRDTSVYGHVLARLQRTDAYDPTVREKLLEALHRPFVRGQESARSPLAQSEAASLLVGDIPYFYADAQSRTIMGSDGTADDLLLESSAIERAGTRITSLDAQQSIFARAVVRANVRRALVPDQSDAPACVAAREPLTVEEALTEAGLVFDTLEGMALMSPSGEESWLFRGEHKGTLGQSTTAFANGLGGVAVFLAAFAARTTTDTARSRAFELLDGCLSRVDEVLEVLENTRTIPERSVGLGIANGLGGVVRSLDLVVRALGTSDTCEKPAACATQLLLRSIPVLEKADIEGAVHLDVYSGAAGMLLALSQCDLARRSSRAKGVAKRLALQLLNARTLVTKDGTRLCDTMGTNWPASGFGHGQAGIGVAFSAASKAYGIDANDACQDSLAWELAAHSERLGTWPDLRRLPLSSRHMHGVCSGAPGVGLCALSVRDETADDAACLLANRLLVRADKACRTLPPNYRDTLCCGNGSLIEYLVSAGRTDDAGCLLAGIVKRQRLLGHYVFMPKGVRPTDDPSLLYGLAGIGYELLRYADPALVGIFVG